MKDFLLKLVVFAIFAASRGQVFAAEVDPSQSDQAGREYSALLKSYTAVSGGLRAAKTDAERRAAVERLGVFAAKFVDLAEKYSTDAVALTALRQAVQVVGSTDSGALQAWEMNTTDFPTGCGDDSTARTIALVLRDHANSDQLGPVIDRMRYAYRLDYERCLNTLLEKNPHHDVRGLACLSLAQYLNDKMRMLRLIEDRPELTECYELVFGKDYLPSLRRLGQSELAERIERQFERAATQYADVKFYNSTVGETARSELYEIRHLGIGKPAPDIDGQDQDGRSFKLSDYRDKVVMLYFWSEY